jgi:drug/metabolite transporter (DMT)-like permease
MLFSEKMNLLKWSGTILCLLGIWFTSINAYPINILFGLVGSGLWTWAGILQRDIPLFLVEVVAAGMYAFGIGLYVYYRIL